MLQAYVSPGVPASSTQGSPVHGDVSGPRSMLMVGIKVTFASYVALHPWAVVMLTEYDPLVKGVMDCVVAEVLHKKELPELPAFKVGGWLMHVVTS